MAVVYGSVFALVVAVAGMAVPWPRLFVRRSRSYVNAMVDVERFGDLPGPVDVVQPMPFSKIAEVGEVAIFDWPTACRGDGFRVVAHESLEVTKKSYANGSTQVWLKRRPA